MSKVICYPRCCTPEYYSGDCYYFEMFSVPEQKLNNVGHVGVQLFKELRKSKIAPTVDALDFTIIAMAVVAADKAILRKKSADGWTRKIELCNHRKVEVLAVTTSPRAYLKTSQYFNNFNNVRVALGFHPELVANRQNEIDLFMEQIAKCRYIGEVGIDGTSVLYH